MICFRNPIPPTRVFRHVPADPRQVRGEAEEDVPEVRADVPELLQVLGPAAEHVREAARRALLGHVDLHLRDAPVQHRDGVQPHLPERAAARGARLIPAPPSSYTPPVARFWYRGSRYPLPQVLP